MKPREDKLIPAKAGREEVREYLKNIYPDDLRWLLKKEDGWMDPISLMTLDDIGDDDMDLVLYPIPGADEKNYKVMLLSSYENHLKITEKRKMEMAKIESELTKEKIEGIMGKINIANEAKDVAQVAQLKIELSSATESLKKAVETLKSGRGTITFECPLTRHIVKIDDCVIISAKNLKKYINEIENALKLLKKPQTSAEAYNYAHGAYHYNELSPILEKITPENLFNAASKNEIAAQYILSSRTLYNILRKDPIRLNALHQQYKERPFLKEEFTLPNGEKTHVVAEFLAIVPITLEKLKQDRNLASLYLTTSLPLVSDSKMFCEVAFHYKNEDFISKINKKNLILAANKNAQAAGLLFCSTLCESISPTLIQGIYKTHEQSEYFKLFKKNNFPKWNEHAKNAVMQLDATKEKSPIKMFDKVPLASDKELDVKLNQNKHKLG